MPLDAPTLTLALVADLTATAGLSVGAVKVNILKNIPFTNGTGASQADKLYQRQLTITASATTTLDLAGSLTDDFGAALTFARIKAVYLFAAAANVNNVNVTRPASNGVPLFMAAGDAIALRPGAALMWINPDATGVVVTAATGDLLDLTNSGGGTSVVVDVVIIGASV